MFRARSRSRSRYGSRRRSVARQQGYRTFSSRVGGGFIQPRVTRAPRLERAKFVDMFWGNGGASDTNYWSATSMLCQNSDEALVPTTQLTSNKRCLNLVVNGSNNNDRVSARIMMKSVLIRGSLYFNPIRANNGDAIPIGGNTTTSTGTVGTFTPDGIDRSVTIFVVYYPRVKLDQYPAWNSLLENPINTQSLLDETNVYGARVLLRKHFRLHLNCIGGTAAAPVFGLGRSTRKDFAWKLNLNLPAEWDNSPGNAPSMVNMRSGQLILFTLANLSGNGGLGDLAVNALIPKMAVRVRLAFVDA